MKYKPSVRNNNSLRDVVAKKLQGIVFDIEKKRYNKDLNEKTIAEVKDTIEKLTKNFEEIVGTGEENVECFYDAAINQIEDVKTQLKSCLSGRLSDAVSDLDYTIDKWSSVLNGDVDDVVAGEDLNEKEKNSAKKKLELKLDELREIQGQYQSNEKRLEIEMSNLERDIEEIDNQIVEEENDRKIGNLVSKVKALKVKLAATNNTYRNYSFCSDLLDMIANLVGEKIEASKFSLSELNKAKAYLKIDDLKKVIAEPERAVATLKKMEDDLKALVPKIEANQAKVNSFGDASLSMDNEAIKYKEELIAKRNAKSQVKESLNELENEEIISKPVKVEEEI